LDPERLPEELWDEWQAGAQTAIHAAELIGTPEARSAIRPALNCPWPDVWLRAAGLLARGGDHQAIDVPVTACGAPLPAAPARGGLRRAGLEAYIPTDALSPDLVVIEQMLADRADTLRYLGAMIMGVECRRRDDATWPPDPGPVEVLEYRGTV